MGNEREFELARLIYSSKYILKFDSKVRLLGSDSKVETIDFLNFRLVSVIVLFVVVIYVSRFGFVLAPVLAIGYYFGIERIMIDSKIKKRERAMEGEAITFFEILTLAIDAGRNLESAIRVTIDSTSSALATEFREVLREVKYGKSLTEALMDMEGRISSDAIKNMILSLAESDIYGSSIIDSLNNQVEYLREKRRMEVKADISKVPIKISIVSVLFFVPLLLLIILGPVLLNYMG